VKHLLWQCQSSPLTREMYLPFYEMYEDVCLKSPTACHNNYAEIADSLRTFHQSTSLPLEIPWGFFFLEFLDFKLMTRMRLVSGPGALEAEIVVDAR